MNNPMIDLSKISKNTDLLVDSFAKSTSLPQGLRAAIEPVICMALLQEGLLKIYIDVVEQSRNRHSLTFERMKTDGEVNSSSIESIIKNGLVDLDDSTFRKLVLKPMALRLVSESLNEKILEGSDEVGEVWWNQIQMLGQGEEVGKVDTKIEVFALDKDVQAISSKSEPDSKKMQSNRYMPMAMALAAAVLVGIGIGIFFSGGREGQSREMFAANATIEKAVPRGIGVALELKVGSRRSGFLSFVVIGQGRPQVLPEYGEELLPIAPNVPVSYGPVDASGTLILCIITETPSTEVLRKLASKGELSSKNPEVLKSVISEALWKANFKWIEFLSMSIPNPK